MKVKRKSWLTVLVLPPASPQLLPLLSSHLNFATTVICPSTPATTVSRPSTPVTIVSRPSTPATILSADPQLLPPLSAPCTLGHWSVAQYHMVLMKINFATKEKKKELQKYRAEKASTNIIKELIDAQESARKRYEELESERIAKEEK